MAQRKFLRTLNWLTGGVLDSAHPPTNDVILPADLPDTAVTPGAYTNASLTVDQQGRITAASSGSGSVSSVSVVAANGVSGSVANGTSTPAITLTLGAITPDSVIATGDVTVGGQFNGSAAGLTGIPAGQLTGTVPAAALPALAITDTFVVASQAGMLALAAERGDVAIRTDVSKTFILSTDSPGTLADWKEVLAPAGGVTSVAGSGGATGLTVSGGPITSAGTLTLGGTLAVASGGTGATSASAARTALGLAIGSDVQAYDADLAAIAGLTSAADRVPYFTGPGTAALAPLTATGRALIAAATPYDAQVASGTGRWVEVAAASNGYQGTLYGLVNVDGAVPVEGDLVLIKNQVTTSENGVYRVKASGAWTKLTLPAYSTAVVRSGGQGGTWIRGDATGTFWGSNQFKIVEGGTGATTAAAARVNLGVPAGSGTSTGTNTGDQTITLTGDVTGTGTGTFATAIGAGKVTNAMLAGSIDLTTKVTGTLPAAALPGPLAGQPFRLTLETGVPVSTSDQTAKSTLYLTRCAPGYVWLWDGAKVAAFNMAADVSLALSGLTAGAVYDVFLYSNGGTLTLELGPAWATATSRAAGGAIAWQNGLECKVGAPTRLWVGTIRATGATTTEDSQAKRLVYNAYNQVNRPLYKQDPSASTVYNTIAWTTYGAGTGKVEWVNGKASDPMRATFVGKATSTSGNTAVVGFHLDASAGAPAQLSQIGGGGFAYLFQDGVCEYDGYPGTGYHYFQSMMAGGGNNSFYGAGIGGGYISAQWFG